MIGYESLYYHVVFLPPMLKAATRFCALQAVHVRANSLVITVGSEDLCVYVHLCVASLCVVVCVPCVLSVWVCVCRLWRGKRLIFLYVHRHIASAQNHAIGCGSFRYYTALFLPHMLNPATRFCGLSLSARIG